MPDGRSTVSQASEPVVTGVATSPTLTGAEGLVGRVRPHRHLSRRKGLGVVFWVCAAWVALMILLAVLASVLPLKAPNFQNYSAVNLGPSFHHLLGTDDLGRDLLSRVIFGSRVSLVIGFAPIAIALVVGGATGLLAGYRSGAADTVLNALSFVLLAFPALLAIMVVELFWEPVSLLKLTVIFAFVASPLLFRVMRATTLSFASREFVVAARAMGAKTSRPVAARAAPQRRARGGVVRPHRRGHRHRPRGLARLPGPVDRAPHVVARQHHQRRREQQQPEANPYIALWPSLYIFLMLTALNLMADRLRSYFDVREVKL